MTKDEKTTLRRRAIRRDLWQQLGFIPKLPLKVALLAIYLAGAVSVRGKQKVVVAFMDTLVLPAPLPEAIYEHLLRSYLLAGLIVFIVLLVYPFNRKMVTDGSLRIALTNAAGETPTLLRERRDKENRRIMIWELSKQGIPLKMWMDKQLEIEAAFDLHVIDVDYGKSTSRIILKFVPGRNTLPNYIEWKDAYLSPDSFVLTLGEGYIGPITIDLATPLLSIIFSSNQYPWNTVPSCSRKRPRASLKISSAAAVLSRMIWERMLSALPQIRHPRFVRIWPGIRLASGR